MFYLAWTPEEGSKNFYLDGLGHRNEGARGAVVFAYHLWWQAVVGPDMGERWCLLGVWSSSPMIKVRISSPKISWNCSTGGDDWGCYVMVVGGCRRKRSGGGGEWDSKPEWPLSPLSLMRLKVLFYTNQVELGLLIPSDDPTRTWLLVNLNRTEINPNSKYTQPSRSRASKKPNRTGSWAALSLLRKFL